VPSWRPKALAGRLDGRVAIAADGAPTLDVKSLALYRLGMKSVVSSKGQITVPAVIRERLGLGTGVPVEFELREGGVFLRKSSRGPHPVDRVFGRLKLSGPVDGLIDEMRGPRPEPERARRSRRRSRLR
jgi:AbrB family looped-hinge helix DNA binding protein